MQQVPHPPLPQAAPVVRLPLELQQQQLQQHFQQQLQQTIVTSCEEDFDEEEGDDGTGGAGASYDSSSVDDDDYEAYQNNLPKGINDELNDPTAAQVADGSSVGADEEPYEGGDDDCLYDDQADEEDAAYVYKHLRSGVAETVKIVAADMDSNASTVNDGAKIKGNSGEAAGQSTSNLVQAYRPRSSDAVLSCPCCFQIVCMDCQAHESYNNLYRAMFVMGIAVQWNVTLRYSRDGNCLVPCDSSDEDNGNGYKNSAQDRTAIALDENASTPPLAATATALQGWNDRDDSVVYYNVCCAQCQTTVAALDMTDEIYYFSGCLAASA